MKKLSLLIVLIFTLSGCAQMQSKQGQGAIFGGGIGAIAGAGLGQAIGGDTESTLIGAGIGAAVGGVAGNQWGKYLDQQEAELRAEFENAQNVQIEREEKQISLTFKSDMMFDTGSAAILPGAYGEISRTAKVLNRYPESIILVRGHTDSTGSETMNQKLSEQRADSVKKNLVSQNVNPDRILTVGYGETSPVANNDTEAGRAANRRVEVKIAPPEMFAQAG
jgi:outer membrane protein OmpA-like peptidoglycan-associated protein